MEVIRDGEQRVISNFDLVVCISKSGIFFFVVLSFFFDFKVGDLLQFSPGLILPADGLLVSMSYYICCDW